MGCAGGRQIYNDVLETIMESERSLGFYQHKPQDLEAAFKKWAHNGLISKQQLFRIQQQLKLKTFPQNELNQSHLNSWKSEDTLVKFYSNFLNDKDNTKCDLQKIVLAAVVMSTDTPSQRASIIFDNLDTESNGQIGVSQINFYINLIGKLMHEYILEYTIGRPYPQNPARQVTRQQIEEQKQQWQQLKFQEELSKLLLPLNQSDLIDKPNFVSKVKNSEIGD